MRSLECSRYPCVCVLRPDTFLWRYQTCVNSSPDYKKYAMSVLCLTIVYYNGGVCRWYGIGIGAKIEDILTICYPQNQYASSPNRPSPTGCKHARSWATSSLSESWALRLMGPYGGPEAREIPKDLKKIRR